MQKLIVPPQCLGIMGGGQLGRMFAISAKQFGYKVAVLEPDSNCPAKYFADHFINTAYDDKVGLDKLVSVANVITTEFENVPSKSLNYLNQFVPVYPSAKAILVAQNRLLEKKFFNDNGIATTKYLPISNLEDLKNVTLDMFPAILKTNTLGYDGKGQIRVNNQKELQDGFQKLNHAPAILEKLVDLKLEVSIVVARNEHEKIAFQIVENIHKNGILDITIAPARIDNKLSKMVVDKGLSIIEKLDYVGVMAIEFFITKDGEILANEMAPRPHNSGHHTIDACLTSQFEQQVRAICNLKLGDTKLLKNAVMLNLLGDIWKSPEIHPDWGRILLKFDNVKLHLYEKTIAKLGRKMGHLTILGDNIDQLIEDINKIKEELGIKHA